MTRVIPGCRAMLRLETLGGLTLADGDGAPLAVPRRRLALLALLAGAGDRGLSRDKLVACLWPESSAENARHALEQLVYSVRRQSSEPLVLGTDPIRLNPAAIGSDVAEFEKAIARGALEQAIALYRGPFLDGFYLSEAAGFEEWCESTRTRLANEHAGALYRMAKEAGGGGKHTVEVDCWRKLAALDPLSERTATGLVRALAGAGDWTSAMKHARSFEARVRSELAVPPAVDLAALVERLRVDRERAAGPPSRYTIQRELGRGAMATVFLARDRKHDRLVALKVLKPELGSTLGAKRFLREISIVAGLHHPHILQLHDSGTLEATGGPTGLYYVMPYVEGESLRDRLSREVQLALPVALHIARQVADALFYAHGQGVVHRDIKPENILLQSGHALVADFGIAHALDLAGGEQLSVSGIALGTPDYMSPEQAAGTARLDGRSDIYSLGCVLYEMLAGETPFTGPTSQVILARHAAGLVPPLRTVCPEVPPAVEAVVLRALAKAPSDRFATAAELAEALAQGAPAA